MTADFSSFDIPLQSTDYPTLWSGLLVELARQINEVDSFVDSADLAAAVAEADADRIAAASSAASALTAQGDAETAQAAAAGSAVAAAASEATVLAALLTRTAGIKIGSFTFVEGEYVVVNTTAGSFTGTFPAAPTAGDRCGYWDVARTFDVNNLVTTSGENIEGSSDDHVLDIRGASGVFEYVDATFGWVERGGMF